MEVFKFGVSVWVTNPFIGEAKKDVRSVIVVLDLWLVIVTVIRIEILLIVS